MMSKNALVTGASSGIGAEFARLLAAEGYGLILVARRADRLQQLATELSNRHGVRCEVLAMDLREPDAVARILSAVADLQLSVDVLINNAGLSGKQKFLDTPWPTLAAELQVMVTAVTELVHGVAPQMQARGWGRIINVSSLAAFSPPGASLLYTAIKSYVLNMSESLDMELKPHGVHITALCPGFTWSEFHDVMGTRAVTQQFPAFLWQQPGDVARAGYAAVMQGRPVCIPGRINRLIAASLRPVPESLRYILGRQFNPFKE